MNRTSKLILGTAQFGMDYGINNASGQVTPEEVDLIIHEAGESGMCLIDTAYDYGNSEEVLGNSLSLHQKGFRVVSKYGQSQLTPIEQYDISVKRLKVPSLYGYMVHNFPTYMKQPSIWNDFIELKESRKVDKIGFSLYDVNELEFILDHDLEVDIIQVPFNILDRKFEPWFPLLKERGIEVHTRSAFLQGLFFKNTDTFNGTISELSIYIKQIQQYCLEKEIEIQDLALGYVLSSMADGVLIGVDSLSQLHNNIHSAERIISGDEVAFIRSVDVKEKKLLSPVNW